VDGVAERLLDGGDLRPDASPTSVGHRLLAGNFTYSAKQPSVADADDAVVRADVGFAELALDAGAADDVRLGGDDLARDVAVLGGDAAADLDDLAEQLVAEGAAVGAVGVQAAEDHVAE
jgi:hypothetical protein